MTIRIKSGGRTLEKQTITQVRNTVAHEGKWEGWTVGNRVNSFNILDGWHLGCRAEFKSKDEIEDHVRSSLWYMERELGNRVAFYKEVL